MTIKKKRHRLLSVLLCCAMLVGLLPTMALAANEQITTGNATITAPVGGETPTFTATTDAPDKYTAEVIRWVDVTKNMDIRPTDLSDPSGEYYNYTFVGGQQYTAVVEFTAKEGYTLSYDNTFTINGKTTWWTGNGLCRCHTFTATGTGGGEGTKVYSATVADINITLPAGYTSNDINNLGENRSIKITNTGTETLYISEPSLSGANASAFSVRFFGNHTVAPGNTNKAYAIEPKIGLAPGTYTATISCTDDNNKLSAPVTATVTLTVNDHNWDTSKWEFNSLTHWHKCTDSGCSAKGDEAAHNSDKVVGAKAATFSDDGYTGDKYCSICDRKMETGKAIAAGKYIRESKATMTPVAITADMCANDLTFTSLEPSKYTVALKSVYDLTDTSLNTATGDKYPNSKKFVDGHKYRIIFEFTAVGSYVYDIYHGGYTSTFTLNGSAVEMPPFTALSGSTNRMVELTAGAGTVTHPAKPTIEVTGTYNYNGSEQTATVTGYDSATMNITGNTGKNAGDYTVSVTSKTGQWADGTTAAVTKNWSIAKADDPAYAVPTGLTGTKGNKLSTVTLPSHWEWKAPDTVMSETGTKTFKAKFTPADTTNYNTVDNVDVTVEVSKDTPVLTSIAVPTAITGLVYTGSEQQGVPGGTGYTLTGHKATNAKEDYKATATLLSGYKWTDGTTAAKEITWSIAKATPSYTVPTGLTGTKGNALSTVILPANWAWVDGTTVMSATGNQTFKANFTPADTENYNTVNDVDVTVEVSKDTPVLTPIAVPTATTGLVYTGSEQQGVPDGTGYTLTGHKATNAKEDYKATATLLSGYKWTDGTTAAKEITWSIAKATPSYTVPTGLTGTKGNALSTVILPANWAWVDGTTVMSATGNQTFKAKFTPADTENYNTVDNVDVIVAVSATGSGSSSGGGGGGGVTKYAVAVSPTDNGKVTPDKTSAAKGSVVTITAMANDGYVLDTIKVTDKDGKEIKLTDKGDGKYTFTMPASKVEVKAAFKQTASKPGKPAEEMKTVVVMQVGSKTMFVNGKAYEKDAAPVIMNDRTLVPIRFVTESLGGTVAWNAETKEVTLVIDGKEIKMTIGKTIEKYGVAPIIINGRTFVPVRFVADELGATTAWNAETKTVTITKAVTPVKTEK